jgi:hypothetical protein
MKPTTIKLLLAFELGERTWKLGFTTGFGQRPRVRQVLNAHAECSKLNQYQRLNAHGSIL